MVLRTAPQNAQVADAVERLRRLMTEKVIIRIHAWEAELKCFMSPEAQTAKTMEVTDKATATLKRLVDVGPDPPPHLPDLPEFSNKKEKKINCRSANLEAAFQAILSLAKRPRGLTALLNYYHADLTDEEDHSLLIRIEARLTQREERTIDEGQS
ncbi:hypothetical protein V8C43DRAFT_307720 [Trichoderma afarasin]